MFDSRMIATLLLAANLLFPASQLGAVEVTMHVPAAQAELAEKLSRASLTVDSAAKDDATIQDILAAARADYARLLGALYERGYYGGVIRILADGREVADIPPLSRPENVSRIELHVDPGPLFVFSQARVAPLAPGTELPEPFARGRPAGVKTIGVAARSGVDGWRDIGHAKANVADQTIIADHPQAELLADIRLAPGPRLTFGNLIVAKPGKVRPQRVREIAGLPTGQVFSPEELKKSSERLRRTGAFRSVLLEEAEVPGPGDTLDITAELVDAKPRRFGFGAELASFEGLTLSGFWLHRNLLGGAERLRIEGEVAGIGGDSGGIDYQLSGRFERPATFTPDTDLILGAKIEETNEPDYRERNARIGVGVSHIFSDRLEGEIGLAYLYSDIDDDLGSRRLRHLLVPARLTFDNRDDALNAKSGVFLDIEATPFLGLDQDTAGARLFADARSYLGLAENDRIVLAGRLQIGSVTGADLDEVPPEMLFFSGGAGTVRGQPYQSLAIDLGGGNRSGGRSFLGISGEVRAQVSGKWSMVAFADTGYIGQDSWGTRNGDWHSGAGLGVRYDTGVGPIRVDLATPLDDAAGEDFELYIGIGQAF